MSYNCDRAFRKPQIKLIKGAKLPVIFRRTWSLTTSDNFLFMYFDLY